MSTTNTAFPLCWPAGRKRTQRPTRSAFQTGAERAKNNLMREIRLLGGSSVILSTNVKLRHDGFPYANQKEPDDRGVAVYFKRYDKDMAFACDSWDKVGDNIHAIALTIESLRGIERWGGGDMMERAFTGFAALPSSVVVARDWREVLECPDARTLEEANEAYKRKRSEAHPDKKTGSHDAFLAINRAWAQAEAELSA